MKLRSIYHSHKLSVLRIHHNNGNLLCPLALHRFISRLLSILLNIHIKADIQIVSWHRLNPILKSILNLHSRCICLSQNHAIHSLQPFLINHLQTDNSLIISSGKAQNSGGKAVIGIISPVILVYLNSGQMKISDPIPDFLIYICGNDFSRAAFFHTFSHFSFIHPQFFTEHPDHLLPILHLIVYHRNGTDRPVRCNHIPCSIDDSSSGRLDAPFSLVKLLCHPAVII